MHALQSPITYIQRIHAVDIVLILILTFLVSTDLIDLQPCSFGSTKEILWFYLLLVLHTVCVLHVQLWMTLYISLLCIERDRMICSSEEINVRKNRMGNQEWTIRRHMQQNTGRRKSKGGSFLSRESLWGNMTFRVWTNLQISSI